MSDDLQRWLQDGHDNKWTMPAAPFWKRLPVVRHFRAAWKSIEVAEHDAFYRGLGLLSTGYDRWVLWGMKKGLERPAAKHEKGRRA
jgi:hypothetical protein